MSTGGQGGLADTVVSVCVSGTSVSVMKRGTVGDWMSVYGQNVFQSVNTCDCECVHMSEFEWIRIWVSACTGQRVGIQVCLSLNPWGHMYFRIDYFQIFQR